MPRRKQERHTDVKDIRSILRLTFEQELSIRAVSERLKISKTSVSTYLLRAREAGLAVWPLPPGLDDDEVLEQRLFRRMGRPPRDSDEPDWPKVASELKRKGVTLNLLWQEYREAHPDGYGYTWFCCRFAEGLSGILCGGPVSSVEEPLAKDDGELCLCLHPFPRRPFPLLGRVVKNEI